MVGHKTAGNLNEFLKKRAEEELPEFRKLMGLDEDAPLTVTVYPDSTSGYFFHNTTYVSMIVSKGTAVDRWGYPVATCNRACGTFHIKSHLSNCSVLAIDSIRWSPGDLGTLVCKVMTRALNDMNYGVLIATPYSKPETAAPMRNSGMWMEAAKFKSYRTGSPLSVFIHLPNHNEVAGKVIADFDEGVIVSTTQRTMEEVLA